jgi:hypothetical protein
LKAALTSSGSTAYNSLTVTFIHECSVVTATDIPTPTTSTYPIALKIEYELTRKVDLVQGIANVGVSGCFSFKIFNADESGEATLPNGVTFEPTTQVITIVKTTTEDIGTLPQKTYDYKLRAKQIYTGDVTFSDFKITFIHQCTEATIKIPSSPVVLNVDYTVIIDESKFYNVDSTNFELDGESGGVRCFVF